MIKVEARQVTEYTVTSSTGRLEVFRNRDEATEYAVKLVVHGVLAGKAVPKGGITSGVVAKALMEEPDAAQNLAALITENNAAMPAKTVRRYTGNDTP